MANIAVQRVQREFREVVSDEAIGKQYYIEASESNILHLKGYINGPPDTPYEGGRFELEMHIPENYPFSPPKVSISQAATIDSDTRTNLCFYPGLKNISSHHSLTKTQKNISANS